MPLIGLKVLSVSLGVLLLLNPGKSVPPSFGSGSDTNQDTSSVAMNNPVKKDKSSGYKAIIWHNDGFVAAGSGGRIDRISVSGSIVRSEIIPGENFNCLLSDNNETIVAGEQGTILISSDKETFRKLNSGTIKNINALALFKGKIIAGSDDGTILIGDGTGSFSKINLAVSGNIVSVTSRTTDCFGVTDVGEIIHTSDGVSWDIFDFNQFYKGFYKPCHFTKVLATEKQIAVAGIQDDGLPVLFFSSLGTVWTERNLNYTNDQGMSSFLKNIPYDIFYSAPQDQFILACSDGKVMTIPSCSHCNKLFAVSTKNLNGISGYSKTFLIVGEDFFIKPINTE